MGNPVFYAAMVARAGNDEIKLVGIDSSDGAQLK